MTVLKDKTRPLCECGELENNPVHRNKKYAVYHVFVPVVRLSDAEAYAEQRFKEGLKEGKEKADVESKERQKQVSVNVQQGINDIREGKQGAFDKAFLEWFEKQTRLKPPTAEEGSFSFDVLLPTRLSCARWGKEEGRREAFKEALVRLEEIWSWPKHGMPTDYNKLKEWLEKQVEGKKLDG